jgi:hypothetical protein
MNFRFLPSGTCTEGDAFLSSSSVLMKLWLLLIDGTDSVEQDVDSVGQ